MPDPAFDGSGVALVTPFDERGVNETVLREIVAYQIEQGTDALIVNGSTGEAAAMTVEEQRRSVAVVVEAAGARVPVIVGCGGGDTRQVCRLAEQAKEAGADGILVSAPPYSRPPQRALIDHFRRVIDAGDLPCIIYNVPGRAAVNVLPDTVLRIADGGRVIGVKEASGDISQVAELARQAAGRLCLWSGNDDQVVPLLALGGRGVISVMANVVPALTHRMVALWLAGDTAASLDLQLRLLPLIGALFAESNPVPVKAAVDWLGFDVGPPRLPLCVVDAAVHERLIHALSELGVESRA